MDEQDSDSLDSLRESSAFEMSVKTARSKAEVLGILRAYDLSEDDFTERFPVLAKATQGLPDVPGEAVPPT
ncbi:hypothetical protein [Streptomyces sp. TBY4]|uniref:hypothetical protein n=1 Tax=Streptomyces sp. TBY4 TaxID=2962030 RepID=UPI0020B83DE2|nr:hypothetical protein [Streptomyces sp. TBY4]MCP3758391.1 hypothetical protein [Streptomyces sp. TBY4]